jgi:hypothetical protein
LLVSELAKLAEDLEARVLEKLATALETFRAKTAAHVH